MLAVGRTIRKTTFKDLPEVMKIYADGRQIMYNCKNPEQWGDFHPPQSMVEEDIKQGKSYVYVVNLDGLSEAILAVFFLCTEPDPTYKVIDGSWLNEEPYGTVHRIARRDIPEAKGAGAFCLNWCYDQTKNIRIDTHKDNVPMLKLLKNLGYTECGIIYLENGDERVAFQKS